MSLEFRKDLRELLIILAVATAAIFWACNAEAQSYVPLTLDMHVTRYPVGDSIYNKNHKTLSSVERVRMVFVDSDKGILLQCSNYTLALKRIKAGKPNHRDRNGKYIAVVKSDIYEDIMNKYRRYIVYRYISQKFIFQYEFVPLPPHPNIGAYAIHIIPVVAAIKK